MRITAAFTAAAAEIQPDESYNVTGLSSGVVAALSWPCSLPLSVVYQVEWDRADVGQARTISLSFGVEGDTQEFFRQQFDIRPDTEQHNGVSYEWEALNVPSFTFGSQGAYVIDLHHHESGTRLARIPIYARILGE